MSEQFQITPLGDHDYLVCIADVRGAVESRFRANTSILEQLHVPETEEQRVVWETAVYLAERQQIGDLPPIIDLEDVAAAYGDYFDELSHRLTAG